MSDPSAPRGCFVGEVRAHGTSHVVVDLARDGAPEHPFEGDADPGEILRVRLTGGALHIDERVARAGSARAKLYALTLAAGLDPVFDDAILAEVEARVRAPGIDDPMLVDLTHLPFVTVDGAGAKDLDQALYIAREEAGYVVWYALADASYYAPPGSALFEEAMRRGASYYLPGFSVPMLPRALSEGLVSLNPDGPRRALTFVVHLDAAARVVRTELLRARIYSRAKLAFGDVTRLVDDRASSPLAGAPFEESLLLFREVGRLRREDAASREVVRYRREEIAIELGGEGLELKVTRSVRDEVELWNEQISLLVNGEGGRLLKESGSPRVQPVYRVHPAPDPARLAELEDFIAGIARVHALPDDPWRWRAKHPDESLAAYLDALPGEGPHARITRAIDRHAVLVNMRSSYATEPGPHFGVGVEPYARFTAPMREVVGIFLHKEAMERGADARVGGDDETLRERVVEVANRARDTQRRMDDLGSRLVIDRLFGEDLARPIPERTRHRGTVMGIASAKVHVTLDEPPLDVKIYLYDMGKSLGGAWLDVGDGGATLRERASQRVVLRVGDAIELVVHGRDPGRDRWVILPAS